LKKIKITSLFSPLYAFLTYLCVFLTEIFLCGRKNNSVKIFHHGKFFFPFNLKAIKPKRETRVTGGKRKNYARFKLEKRKKEFGPQKST
jgi:hypothetical protein